MSDSIREAEPSLLIVKDDEFAATLLVFACARHGLPSTLVDTGAAAMKHLSSGAKYLGVILDVRLPQVGGLELLSYIRNRADLKDLPVMILSAWDSSEAMVRAFESGADDYVTKPFDPEVFLARVKRLIHRRNAPALGQAPGHADV